MKILIVDDDPIFLLIVRAWLESDGHDIVTQDKPFGTSNTVTRERPDLVVLDVEMPGLSGEALASILGGRAQRVDIVFLSGRPRAELEAMVARHGALGYVAKSRDGRQFIAEFKRVIARHKGVKAGPV